MKIYTNMSKKYAQLKKEFAELQDILPEERTNAQSKRIEALAEELNNLDATEGVMVEIARSFSYKMSLPGYENRDFFTSQKAECEWNDASEVAEALYDFCKAQTLKSVNAYKRELDAEKNAKARKVEVKQDAKNAAEIDVISDFGDE